MKTIMNGAVETRIDMDAPGGADAAFSPDRGIYLCRFDVGKAFAQ
jgi:hypothetical protein